MIWLIIGGYVACALLCAWVLRELDFEISEEVGTAVLSAIWPFTFLAFVVLGLGKLACWATKPRLRERKEKREAEEWRLLKLARDEGLLPEEPKPMLPSERGGTVCPRCGEDPGRWCVTGGFAMATCERCDSTWRIT